MIYLFIFVINRWIFHIIYIDIQQLKEIYKEQDARENPIRVKLPPGQVERHKDHSENTMRDEID